MSKNNRQQGFAWISCLLIGMLVMIFLLGFVGLGAGAVVNKYLDIGGGPAEGGSCPTCLPNGGGGGGCEGGSCPWDGGSLPDISGLLGNSDYPIKPPIMTGRSKHWCTVTYKGRCHDAGHRKFHRTTSPIGDAVDIRSKSGNTTVFAVFDGKIVNHGSGKLGSIWLYSKWNPGVFAIYAHTKNRPPTGTWVLKGLPIGQHYDIKGTAYRHVHFEMWTSWSSSITGSSKYSADPPQYNRSIWENIANYLGLDPKWEGVKQV